MVRPVDRLVGEFARAGASALISFHPEALGPRRHARSASSARRAARPGSCSIRPRRSSGSTIRWRNFDFVLLMSVNPGFGGQQFIAAVLPKIAEARRRIDAVAQRTGREIWLEVDGGVKADNVADIARAGADTFVAGSGDLRRARLRRRQRSADFRARLAQRWREQPKSAFDAGRRFSAIVRRP
ncbi:MAG: hypothetical protein RML56_14910 [Burkholderiales bacterium]|nr:hypothetical protein [Burkholderiales bacterium]